MLGGDPGLQFIVRGGAPVDGYIPVAQMNSARDGLLWGSYRASLKLTPIAGTCSAFFWASQISGCLRDLRLTRD